VVMRRRHPRLVVDMDEHLEAERLVLVQELEPARHILAAVRAYELRIRQQALEVGAHGFAPRGAGVAGEVPAAIGNELFKIVGHWVPPFSRSEGHGDDCRWGNGPSPSKPLARYSAVWWRARSRLAWRGGRPSD